MIIKPHIQAWGGGIFITVHTPQACPTGHLDSVEWNGGLEQWTGMVEWWNGMEG